MSHLCNSIQSSGRGTAELDMFEISCCFDDDEWCGWWTEADTTEEWLTLRDTLARFDVRGGDAGGVINIPVLLVLFFWIFKRQIHSDIYKCNFLRIEFTSFRSHQLTEGSHLCISLNQTPKSSNKYLIWIVNVKSLKLSRSSSVRGRLYRSLHPQSSNFRSRKFPSTQR